MTRPPSPGTEGYPALVEARCVIAATSQTIDGSSVDSNGRPVQYQCPIAILDDGSAFRLDGDGQWRKILPVPTTHAGIAFQRKVDAQGPIEE